MIKSPKDNELDFVLQHYIENRFSPDEAMKKIGAERTSRHIAMRHVMAIAASLLCLVVMGAVSWQLGVWGSAEHVAEDRPPVKAEVTVAASADDQSVPNFHFDDTPLPEVLSEIGQHYGVKLQASDTTRHLTGDFTGEQLDDIIESIEEVLGVNISQNGK